MHSRLCSGRGHASAVRPPHTDAPVNVCHSTTTAGGWAWCRALSALRPLLVVPCSPPSRTRWRPRCGLAHSPFGETLDLQLPARHNQLTHPSCITRICVPSFLAILSFLAHTPRAHTQSLSETLIPDERVPNTSLACLPLPSETLGSHTHVSRSAPRSLRPRAPLRPIASSRPSSTL